MTTLWDDPNVNPLEDLETFAKWMQEFTGLPASYLEGPPRITENSVEVGSRWDVIRYACIFSVRPYTIRYSNKTIDLCYGPDKEIVAYSIQDGIRPYTSTGDPFTGVAPEDCEEIIKQIKEKADEQLWDEAFANSQDELATLANEALEEYDHEQE